MKKNYFKPEVCIVEIDKEIMDVIKPTAYVDPDANSSKTFDEEEENDNSPIWDASTGE